jgi:hypothetical protein
MVNLLRQASANGFPRHDEALVRTLIEASLSKEAVCEVRILPALPSESLPV